MKTYFMNNGDFDVRAMLTMGVSAKQDDDAIGFFGTGFKYAVAIILQLGGTVSIKTLSGEYKFTAKTEMVRGKEFQIVYCNDREAGFTTRMGINWEPWMAFRELYCNAKDEGGEISNQPSDYDTVITVNCHEIAKCYNNQEDYFLESQPLYEDSRVSIHKGSKPFIYYRGIAVIESFDNQMYTYNIKGSVDLTEDRTAKYQHQIVWPIQRAWQGMNDHAMLRTVLRNGDHAEARIGFDADWLTSEEFVDVCQELMKTDSGCCESARKLVESIQETNGNWPEFQLTTVQQKMLDRAITFLDGIGVDINMYPIKTVSGLGNGVMGRALDRVIYLSEMPFNMGTKQLASTLLEEWVHNKTGADDFDRLMQNWLFDKILSLAEEINGEPV